MDLSCLPNLQPLPSSLGAIRTQTVVQPDNPGSISGASDSRLSSFFWLNILPSYQKQPILCLLPLVGTKILLRHFQLLHPSFSLRSPSLLSSCPINVGSVLLGKGGHGSEAFLKKQMQLQTSARSRVLPGLGVSSSTSRRGWGC